MTPIFITDVFLVSADRKRGNDGLTELSVPERSAPCQPFTSYRRPKTKAARSVKNHLPNLFWVPLGRL